MSAKVMWGDPPKPNIWKVLKKMSHSYYVVEIGTPIPNLTVKIETLEPTLGSEATLEVFIDNGRHEYLIWQSDDLRSFQDFDMFYHYILSHAFWKEIARSFKNDSDVKKHNLRLASSEPKVMWGDPPKPNLWKLEKRIPKLYVIKSPLFKDDQEIHIYESNGDTYVKFSESRERIAVYSTGIGSAIPLIANKNFWAYYKDKITPHLKVDKVASSKHKVMWGDPPKPNLWEMRHKVFDGVKSNVMVRSPLIKGDRILIFLEESYGHTRIRVMNGEFLKDIFSMTRSNSDIEDTLDFIKSPEFWHHAKDYIKPLMVVNKIAKAKNESTRNNRH